LEETSKNTDGGIGELNFEFFEKGKDDSDKEFASSVKNILILVKDFYGADSAAVYWFNKNKQGFKLLAASEDERIGEYLERFSLGNDYISTVCLRKNAEIFNIGSDKEKELISHYKGDFNVKSLMAYPLLYDDEVIAIVLCESKTQNFFGTPNMYSLKVFAESVANYIRYFSQNEDFEFESRLLKILASGKLKSRDETCEIIKSVFDRFVSYDRLYILFGKDNRFNISAYNSGENDSGVKSDELAVEDGSILLKSVKERKIIIKDFDSASDKAFRFSKKDEFDLNGWFCCIPVMMGDKCIGAAAFDFKKEFANMSSLLSDVYKLIFPFFVFSGSTDTAEEDSVVKDEYTGMYSEDFFLTRIEAEINKCRLFNDNGLYCIYASVDNFDNLPDAEEDGNRVEKLFYEFLKEKFSGYDMMFRLGKNKYAVISSVCSDENVFLEIEKIRKSLSAKIYNIEDKDINFTASFAIKRYVDLNMSKDDYLNDLDNLLKLALNEGGNIVKI
jgi:diguanylate cyclase (GGDEF)-like protein